MKKKIIISVSAIILGICLIVFSCFLIRAYTPVPIEETQKTASAEPDKVYKAEKDTEKQSTGSEHKESSDEKNTNNIKSITASTETTKEQETEAGTYTETHNRTESETEKATVTVSEARQEILVTVTISCRNAVSYGADVPDYFLQDAYITLESGATVFDALSEACKANGISLEYQSKSYITSIGGLKEKDCGGASGWLYRVNSSNPMKPASKYRLTDGDSVEWYYITNSNDK